MKKKSPSKPKILVILGPTASGKSALAVKLARKFKGEVISADSRQVYQGLDIGSGKVTKKETRGIPHHLLDVASPKKVFTSARYKRLAQKEIKAILRRGRLPVVCGGTGFYIDALISGRGLPAVPPNASLRKELEKSTVAELYQKLKALDPRRAATIDGRNKRRLIRALEIIKTTGRAVPPLQRERSAKYEVLKIGIEIKPEELGRKIKKRLLERLKLGLIREVENLHEAGISYKRLDDLGLEYRYASRYLQGLISYEEMVSKLETEIWRYAKRQMTWFKKDKEIIWIKNEKEAKRTVADFLT